MKAAPVRVINDEASDVGQLWEHNDRRLIGPVQRTKDPFFIHEGTKMRKRGRLQNGLSILQCTLGKSRMLESEQYTVPRLTSVPLQSAVRCGGFQGFADYGRTEESMQYGGQQHSEQSSQSEFREKRRTRFLSLNSHGGRSCGRRIFLL